MNIYIGKDKQDMARHAAAAAADKIRKAIAEKGEARIIVATGASLASCQNNYKDPLLANGIIEEEQVGEIAEETVALPTKQLSSKVTEIRSANISGNTVFYFKMAGQEDRYFCVNAKDYPMAVIVNVGDRITLEYIPSEEVLIDAGLVG